MTPRAFFAPGTALLIAALFTPAQAQDSPAAPLGDAARAARQDLDRSVKALADLRESIRSETVPLTKELAEAEGRLADEKRTYDEVSRRQDGARLEYENLGQAIKLRQEEAAYVGNLLDEYARGFDTVLHVGERPRVAADLEAARQAPQERDLTPRERCARQVGLLNASVARLNDLLGGTLFPGQAVDPGGTVRPGTFALIGPVSLFAAADGVAGIALPQAGSDSVAVRPLDEAGNAEVAQVAAAGKGLFPFDASRGGALQELINRGSLVGYFKKGGPIMWPLLCVSILAMSVILERLFFLARERRRRDPDTVAEIMSRLESGDADGALRAGEGSRDYVARSLTYALAHRQKSFSDALMRATNQETVRFERAIPILDTIVTMAPMLGLLGTVTGIMNSFGMLGGGELGAPAQITGGIAEALIATAFGLGIAITTLIPMNYLHTRSEEARNELGDAATHLELLMKPILDAEMRLRGARMSRAAAPDLADGIPPGWRTSAETLARARGDA
ncbi:MAG TPA: MotA/TolQ/ExbB proton channel family protein [Candidatus Dormibacteraeota bacterium]|nr:MotA/TolQ/ExbB proton channel family protein [Candidatus Dormibacteraeota bacterium]